MIQPNLPVIITRAEPGASETAARLESAKVLPILSPVLVFKDRPETQLPASEALSGLIFTSANGVRAFVARSDDRHLPAWCVGPATALAARNAGFAAVHESAGNAVDLALFIAARTSPGPLPLLHIANAAAKGDLARQLAELGFTVEFAPLYDMQPQSALAPAARSILDARTPALVLIHSAKGAERFAKLCDDVSTESLIAIAISEPAARPLAALNLKTVHTASQPNEDSLMSTLHSVIATLSA